MSCYVCVSSYWWWNACKGSPHAAVCFPNVLNEANSLSPTRYRPYKSLALQVLSCSCACLLVAISGLLLRSLVLVSAGRSPNFETADPNSESTELSKEIRPIIVLLITFLSCPLILTIFLLARTNPSVKSAADFFFIKAKRIRYFFATRLFHFHSDSQHNKSRSDSDFEKSAVGSSQDVAIELSPNYTQTMVPAQPVFLIFNGYGESDHQVKLQDQGNLSRGAQSVQSSPVDRLHIQPLSALHFDDIELLVDRDDDIEVVDRDSAVIPSMQSPIAFQRRLQTPQARQHRTGMITSDSQDPLKFGPSSHSFLILMALKWSIQRVELPPQLQYVPFLLKGRLKHLKHANISQWWESRCWSAWWFNQILHELFFQYVSIVRCDLSILYSSSCTLLGSRS